MTHPIHLSHLFEGFSEQRNKWGRSSAKAVGALLHGRLLGLHVGPLKRARAIARHLAAISLRKPWSSLSQVKLQQAVQWNRDILPPPLCPLLPLPITESNPQGTLPSKLIIQSKMFLKQIHLPFKVHICLQIPKKKCTPTINYSVLPPLKENTSPIPICSHNCEASNILCISLQSCAPNQHA